MQYSLNTLFDQLSQCRSSQKPVFFRRLRQLRKRPKDPDFIDAINQLAQDLQASILDVQQRIEQRPVLNYPEELPICQSRDRILEAIKSHQVVVLCGETGSGKTTQLPKICLELGRGTRGLIGHTQPRRLAARAVASRIAEELQSEVGEAVGYRVRFTDKVSERSYIKLMTDGILLAEIQSSRFLDQYDTLIIDEAHERSLNIDFLLGYLKQLLPKRPDLKLIITSATIDPSRFSRHFDNAPVIEVSGRTYPVEVQYQPPQDRDEENQQEIDLQQGIINAVKTLSKLERGDILVFLSGEREIRKTAESLQKENFSNTEILPLLARLSAQEQNRIFHSGNQRRIILATNVAETSLTVPGIKYVIDSGVARISRYSFRSKVQRLPIEKVSQASADQRKGRCGRVSAGVCIRLYAEDDFLNRPEFSEPEILRTNLASVILKMEQLRLGHIDDFPFVEVPDQRLIKDGYALLFELGAMNERHQITNTGRQLSRLPLDPRLGRMLLAANEEGFIAEVLIITAMLAVQDPRERPMDRQQAADEAHRRHHDPRSDFIAILNLWRAFESQQKQLSQNKLRRWCRENFISYLRMREWQDIQKQVKEVVRSLGMRLNQQEADFNSIHRALLCGLLGNLGFKTETREYLGARNRKFHLFPGSALFSKSPKWVMVAEMVETSRLYARTNAKIDPQWIEQKAKHLLKRSHTEPRWEKRRAQVSANEKTTLYGLVINPQRKVNYGSINPEESREIFIRSALVEGEYLTDAKFFLHNQSLIEDLEGLEAKSRRQDIIVDEEELYAFYDKRIPAGIYSGPLFEKWRKQAEKESPNCLVMKRQDLMRHDANQITTELFPDHLSMNGAIFPLEYHFDPVSQSDGITLLVPLAALNMVNASRIDWLVPGLLYEKVVALIKSLPKSIRRNFVPAPNFADACMQVLTPCEQSLSESIAVALKKITGIEINPDAWQRELLPSHLVMNFRVLDRQGKVLGEGRDLEALKAQFSGQADTHFETQTQHSIERDEVTEWDFGELPESVELEVNGMTLKAYPALVVDKKKVTLRLKDHQGIAEAATRKGLRQLVINVLADEVNQLKAQLPDIQQLSLMYANMGRSEALKSDLISAVIDSLFVFEQPRTEEVFNKLLAERRGQLHSAAVKLCKQLKEILTDYRQIQKRLKNPPLACMDAMADMQDQLNHLVYPHFITEIPESQLQHYPRYLQAILKRLEKLAINVTKDRSLHLEVIPFWSDYKALEKNKTTEKKVGAVIEYRWAIEEFRVSLFAQTLKTAYPISSKRLKVLQRGAKL
ncbi:MAG: ATP-dependent RNA helicase HrpA [Gammaproteobacteria bacterium]|nr:ATP-dependent RNA helicase HrpA [Gammaproteobacteria bacterium]